MTRAKLEVSLNNLWAMREILPVYVQHIAI